MQCAILNHSFDFYLFFVFNLKVVIIHKKKQQQHRGNLELHVTSQSEADL